MIIYSLHDLDGKTISLTAAKNLNAAKEIFDYVLRSIYGKWNIITYVNADKLPDYYELNGQKVATVNIKIK